MVLTYTYYYAKDEGDPDADVMGTILFDFGDIPVNTTEEAIAFGDEYALFDDRISMLIGDKDNINAIAEACRIPVYITEAQRKAKWADYSYLTHLVLVPLRLARSIEADKSLNTRWYDVTQHVADLEKAIEEDTETPEHLKYGQTLQ